MVTKFHVEHKVASLQEYKKRKDPFSYGHRDSSLTCDSLLDVYKKGNALESKNKKEK